MLLAMSDPEQNSFEVPFLQPQPLQLARVRAISWLQARALINAPGSRLRVAWAAS